MKIFLILWTLTFTAPSLNRGLPSCPVWCRDSTSDSTSLTDLSSFFLYRYHQSPTWVSKRDSMLSTPSLWDKYWPTVRIEASQWVGVVVWPCLHSDAGKVMHYTVSDTSTGWWWGVWARDSVGNQSCMGKEIFR